MYFTQTTLLPKGLCDQIDKLVRKFLWGDSLAKKRVNLLNWDKVTRRKDHGGLGIRTVDSMNLAFLAKLGWRLISEKRVIFGLGLLSISKFEERLLSLN